MALYKKAPLLLILLLFNFGQIKAQEILRILDGYVLINLDEKSGYRVGDEVKVIRTNFSDKTITIGLIEIIKYKDDKCAGKIINEEKGYSIEVGDKIEMQEDVTLRALISAEDLLGISETNNSKKKKKRTTNYSKGYTHNEDNKLLQFASIGYGPSYAGLGFQFNLYGTHGGGINLAIGQFKNKTLYSANAKFFYSYPKIAYSGWSRSYFIGFSTGGIGVKTESTFLNGEYREEESVLTGWNFMIGGRYGVYKQGALKGLFIETSIGYLKSDKITFFEGTLFEMDYEISAVSYEIGIGYSF